MAGTAKVGRAAKGRRWLVRGALAGAVALLAAISIQDTAAQVAARTNLQLAHMLDPGAGRIAGRLAERTFAAEMQAAPDSRAAKLALQALRNDPTAVEAAATLALLAQLHAQAPIETLDWVGPSMGGLIGMGVVGQPGLPLPVPVRRLV